MEGIQGSSHMANTRPSIRDKTCTHQIQAPMTAKTYPTPALHTSHTWLEVRLGKAKTRKPKSRLGLGVVTGSQSEALHLSVS